MKLPARMRAEYTHVVEGADGRTICVADSIVERDQIIAALNAVAQVRRYALRQVDANSDERALWAQVVSMTTIDISKG